MLFDGKAPLGCESTDVALKGLRTEMRVSDVVFQVPCAPDCLVAKRTGDRSKVEPCDVHLQAPGVVACSLGTAQ